MVSKLAKFIDIIVAIVTLTYPFLLWFAIHSEQSFYFALAMILLGVLKLLRKKKPSMLLSINQQYFLSLMMIGMGVVTLLFKNAQVFQLYPLIISAVFFIIFASSLSAEKSMIEVFASKIEKNITAEKKHYMRKLTKVWCGFFIVNIIFSLISWGLGLNAWLLYNGVISYMLMGLLFIAEYGYRHYKFAN